MKQPLCQKFLELLKIFPAGGRTAHPAVDLINDGVAVFSNADRQIFNNAVVFFKRKVHRDRIAKQGAVLTEMTGRIMIPMKIIFGHSFCHGGVAFTDLLVIRAVQIDVPAGVERNDEGVFPRSGKYLLSRLGVLGNVVFLGWGTFARVTDTDAASHDDNAAFLNDCRFDFNGSGDIYQRADRYDDRSSGTVHDFFYKLFHTIFKDWVWYFFQFKIFDPCGLTFAETHWNVFGSGWNSEPDGGRGIASPLQNFSNKFCPVWSGRVTGEGVFQLDFRAIQKKCQCPCIINVVTDIGIQKALFPTWVDKIRTSIFYCWCPNFLCELENKKALCKNA